MARSWWTEVAGARISDFSDIRSRVCTGALDRSTVPGDFSPAARAGARVHAPASCRRASIALCNPLPMPSRATRSPRWMKPRSQASE